MTRVRAASTRLCASERFSNRLADALVQKPHERSGQLIDVDRLSNISELFVSPTPISCPASELRFERATELAVLLT